MIVSRSFRRLKRTDLTTIMCFINLRFINTYLKRFFVIKGGLIPNQYQYNPNFVSFKTDFVIISKNQMKLSINEKMPCSAIFKMNNDLIEIILDRHYQKGSSKIIVDIVDKPFASLFLCWQIHNWDFLVQIENYVKDINFLHTITHQPRRIGNIFLVDLYFKRDVSEHRFWVFLKEF